MTNEMDLTPRMLFVDALREMARLFETKPEIPLPTWKQDVTVFLRGDDQKAQLAQIAKALGRVDKSYNEEIFELDHKLNNLLQLRVLAYRKDVCERVVVTHIVPERVVELVEWRCTPEVDDD